MFPAVSKIRTFSSTAATQSQVKHRSNPVRLTSSVSSIVWWVDCRQKLQYPIIRKMPSAQRDLTVMFTPKGFCVNRLVSLIATRRASGLGCVSAVKMPNPPASETAAARAGTPTCRPSDPNSRHSSRQVPIASRLERREREFPDCQGE